MKSMIVLLSICLLIALLMAPIYLLTQPKIEAAEQKAEEEALRAVLTEATEFEALEGEYPEEITALYEDVGGAGYAALLEVKGYDSATPMKIAVGFDAEGKILAVKIISANGETPGIGAKVKKEDFLSQFVAKDATLSGVDTIGGATISSRAVKDAVQAAATAVAEEVAS